MAFKIPQIGFGGKPVEGSLGRILDKSQETTQAQPISPASFSGVTASMTDPTQYVRVDPLGILIGKREIHKGLNWEQTQYKLSDEGLFMPSPRVFMTHFMNARKAAEGQATLYDGNNRPLVKSEAEELWDYLSSTTRGNMGNCWTWLNARFTQNSNELVMAEYRCDPITNNLQPTNSASIGLTNYVKENGALVDLDFNNQGLPVRKSRANNYVQGQNIYFWQPIVDKVARFDADSSRALLNCSGDPRVSNSALGVFPCAEGTGAQKSGVSQ